LQNGSSHQGSEGFEHETLVFPNLDVKFLDTKVRKEKYKNGRFPNLLKVTRGVMVRGSLQVVSR